MLFKILVFNGENCVIQHFRKIVVFRNYAALQCERGKRATSVIVQHGIGDRAIGTEVTDLREISGKYNCQSSQNTHCGRCEDQAPECNPSESFATTLYVMHN